MKNLKRGLVMAALVASAAGNSLAQEDLRRFKLIPYSQMTSPQRAYAEGVMSGPSGSVATTGSTAVVPGANTIGSPFNVYLRSPELAEQLLKTAQHIRFKSSLPARLNEFAILITARYWGAQYEWIAHHPLALKAGLNRKVAEDLALGKRPSGMQEDEAAVYNFSHELHNQHAVSDATFKAVLDRFGEQGVMDLIAVNGFYTLVSMVLNVDRTPVPGGGKPPLPPLK